MFIKNNCDFQQTRLRSADVILRISRTDVRKQRVSLGLQKRTGNISLRIGWEHIQERMRDANAKLRVGIFINGAVSSSISKN